MASPSTETHSSRDLLDAQAHVWNHIFNFINSMCLKCAIELRIPDVINQHGKPMPLSHLADAIPIDTAKTQCLRRLMRILTHSKFFARVQTSDDECYALTPASTLLLKDNPLGVAPLVRSMLDPALIDTWHDMGEWFLNDGGRGPTPFFAKHGMPLWEYFGAVDARGNRMFNEAMACDARLVAGVLSGECRGVFEGVRSLVDVGGGTGMVAKGIAGAFPEMECVVLDLAHVVEGMEGGPNLKYVSGDMFDRIPHADALLLKFILHDWNDQECIKLLKRCKDSIIPSKNQGSKLIIIEMIVDEEKEEHEETETKLFFDVMMMVLVTGKERTEKEWAELFYAAGFSTYKITGAIGLRSIIEVFP